MCESATAFQKIEYNIEMLSKILSFIQSITNIVFLFGLDRKFDVFEFLVVTEGLKHVLVSLVQLLASNLTIRTTLVLHGLQ